MDLLNCPKCNKEVDATAEYCPSCGCKIKKKKVNPKMVIIPIILVVIICTVCIIKVVVDSGSPAKQAVKLINADYGKDIDISAVYYNEEQNGCIVEFTSNGIEDVACVHLEEKLIGYESEYEALAEKMDTAYSYEDKQKYALQIIEYPYDALWVYNLYMYGTSGSGWKKVE